eukprot:scaffold40041_cov33-Tisochrysis_lutea.AAC.5
MPPVATRLARRGHKCRPTLPVSPSPPPVVGSERALYSCAVIDGMLARNSHAGCRASCCAAWPQ